jgi:hypothetical protein
VVVSASATEGLAMTLDYGCRLDQKGNNIIALPQVGGLHHRY